MNVFVVFPTQVMNAVAPHKDVDGFHTLNIGCFCADEKAFIPATPAGVMEMLKRTGMFLSFFMDLPQFKYSNGFTICCLSFYHKKTYCPNIIIHLLVES